MSTKLWSEQSKRMMSEHNAQSKFTKHFLPYTFVLLLLCAYAVVDAVLPLYGLWFHTASLTTLGSWTLLPTHLLFPSWQLTPTLSSASNGTAPPFTLSWKTTGLLLLALLLVFLGYLAALGVVAKHIGLRFILISTVLFGLFLLFAPVVTSQDIYSYIIYARMQVLYDLNPLITSPMSVLHDPTYNHLYWTNQPSAYGPTWIFLTSCLQWLSNIFGTLSLTPMILALRMLNLLAHLGSTLLLWSLSRQVRHNYGYKKYSGRVLAVMAFAWNPLLLFEACVNGHNDTVVLFFILLALWCLMRKSGVLGYLLAAFVFALATCLKVNVLLLLPGLLLFLWSQIQQPLLARLRHIALALLVYIGTILALYAPFWSHGSILLILQVNPGTSRATNSIAEFLSHLYNSLVTHSTQESGFIAETLARFISELLFVVAYLALCLHSLRTHLFTLHTKHFAQSPFTSMVRWMALAWLLYCLLGSPWFWPWYLVTFFGLFALLEATSDNIAFRLVPAVRILAFSMVSLYCFYTWSPYGSFVPLLFHFRWAYLRGLWAWLLPCIPLLIWMRTRQGHSAETDAERKSTI